MNAVSLHGEAWDSNAAVRHGRLPTWAGRLRHRAMAQFAQPVK